MYNCAGMTRLSPSPPSQTCGGMVNMNGISAVNACITWLISLSPCWSVWWCSPWQLTVTHFSLMPKRHPQVLFQFEKRRVIPFSTLLRFLRHAAGASKTVTTRSLKIFLDCTRPKSGPEIAWKKNYPTGHTVAGCLLAAKILRRTRTHTHTALSHSESSLAHTNTHSWMILEMKFYSTPAAAAAVSSAGSRRRVLCTKHQLQEFW